MHALSSLTTCRLHLLLAVAAPAVAGQQGVAVAVVVLIVMALREIGRRHIVGWPVPVDGPGLGISPSAARRAAATSPHR